MPPTPSSTVVLQEQPGYYIRRLQQIAVAVFLEETQSHGITPVQYAALHAVQRQPGLDQRTLASAIGLDTSTLGGVIERLERRGWITRQVASNDRRMRILHATPSGARLLQAIAPDVLRAQARMLAPLQPQQRDQFLSLLRQVVESNNEHSRAPREV